jgi:hypothetical protein
MRTSWFSTANKEYLAYLKSKEWLAKREQVIQRCGGLCERCGKYLVDNVHHLTYERIFNEPLEDLQGLCRPCHAFLHQHSGIDPVVKSIQVKVAFKIIEFWDSEKDKFRRVRLDSLPSENFQWSRIYHGDELVSVQLADEQVGLYTVPVDVFLDGEGRPRFEPAKWQRYKTGSRRSGGWMSYETRGRDIPPDPEDVRRELERCLSTARAELTRYESRPAVYRPSKATPFASHRELMALLRGNPRIITRHGNCEISYVRYAKRKIYGSGVTFRIEWKAEGLECWTVIRSAEPLLDSGELVFDTERAAWVDVGNLRFLIARYGGDPNC